VIFVAVTLCVASQRMFIFVSVYFVIDSVLKLLDKPPYKIISNCLVHILPKPSLLVPVCLQLKKVKLSLCFN
jgi:hypothetical protein